MNVDTPSTPASTISTASITRESSPPDAPRCSGRTGAPACATSWNSTSSTPEGPKASRRPSTEDAVRVVALAHHDRQDRIRHGQAGELGGHDGFEPAGGRDARPRQPRRGVGQPGKYLVALRRSAR